VSQVAKSVARLPYSRRPQRSHGRSAKSALRAQLKHQHAMVVNAEAAATIITVIRAVTVGCPA
jgi:hypothetical protein